MISLAGSAKLRVSAGLAAQAYSQVIGVVMQLVSVPLLLAWWGAAQYGVWLIVSAVPAYLALADLGFAQVGASEMTMRVARGDRRGAGAAYHTIFAMNCTLGLVGFALMAGFAWSPLSDGLIAEAHGGPEVRIAITALAFHALMSLLRGVIAAAMRSVGRFSTMSFIMGTLRLLDMCVLLLVAMLGGGLVEVALAIAGCAMLANAGIAVWFQRRYPWLSLGFGNVERALAKEMFEPSLHYLGITLGTLVSIQGATIVIGAVLGPVAVAAASTTRTLARLGNTAAMMLNQTLQPEYSTRFGQGNAGAFRRLAAFHIRAVGAIAVLYLLAMLLLGPTVYAVWTKGAVNPPALLLPLLAGASACDMLWSALQTPAIAVNRMRLTGRTFFAASAAGLAALYLLSAPLGVVGFGWVSLALSLGMLAVAALEWRRLGATLDAECAPHGNSPN